MKGAIVLALKEMMLEKFGKDSWESSLKKAGIDKEPMVLQITDVDDQVVLKVIHSVCEVLNITLQQAADAFGDYWVNVYAQKTYKAFFEGVNSAKEFLLKMDEVHVTTTRSMPNANPPRFDYVWKNDKTLIMKYKSYRNMVEFLIGLIKGVGKHYNENLTVNKISDSEVEITF